MEQVGVEFFFSGKQAAQGVTDLGKRFFTMDRMQGLAVKGFNAFKTTTAKGFAIAQRGGNLFVNGLTKIRAMFDRARESSKNFGEETTKNLKESTSSMAQMGVSAFQIAKGFLIANVAMKGFNALSQSVPAIGQTFEQMGRVISANIVYPLVQEVIPILKSMMDWVSKNRVNFVQIGKVVSNLFRAIWQVVKTVVSSIQSLFTRMWETVFGKGTLTFKKFMDYLNLLTLKIAFITTFLGLMLEPIFEKIGDGFDYAWNNHGKQFFEDLKNGITAIMPALATIGGFISKNIGGAFQTLINIISALWNGVVKPFLTGFWDGLGNLFDANGDFMASLQGIYDLFIEFINFVTPAIAFLAPAFKFIGYVLGYIVAGGIKMVIRQIYGFMSGIKEIYTGIMNFIDNIKSLYNSIIEWFVGIGTAIKDGIMSGINAAKDYVKNSWVGKVLTKIGVDVGGGAEGGGGPTGGGTPATKFSGNGGTSGGGGSGASYVDNKQIKFEINNPDPKEVANEVERKMKETDKTKKQFQKAARMQGRD